MLPQPQSIPLPTGLAGTQGSPQKKELVRNMFYGADTLKYRPIVDNFLDLGGFCRGYGTFRNLETGDEELYGVFGNTFKKDFKGVQFKSEDYYQK